MRPVDSDTFFRRAGEEGTILGLSNPLVHARPRTTDYFLALATIFGLSIFCRFTHDRKHRLGETIFGLSTFDVLACATIQTRRVVAFFSSGRARGCVLNSVPRIWGESGDQSICPHQHQPPEGQGRVGGPVLLTGDGGEELSIPILSTFKLTCFDLAWHGTCSADFDPHD